MLPIMLTAKDGVKLSGYKWPLDNPKAVITIVHGMAEHSARYEGFAKVLNDNGYAVFALDLRGHGKSVQDGLMGYFARKNGWKKVLEDIKGLADLAKEAYPGAPSVLFGHSMGSIFARVFMVDYGKQIDACIMSGVTISQKGLRDVAPIMTKIFSLFGARKPSKILDSMSFGSFNKQFEPARTQFDWLSCDRAQVDKYIEDELCGFICTAPLFNDVASAILYTLKEKNINRIPKSLKVLILSGGKDPVGSNGYDAKYLYDSYTGAGISAEYKIYENSRHELLNEINKEEVESDIIAYLEKIIA